MTDESQRTSSQADRTQQQQALLALFATLFLLYLLVMPGQVRSDALHPFWAIERIFPRGSFWPQGLPDLGDRPGMTVGMFPFYFLGHMIALFVTSRPQMAAQIIEFVVSLTNPIAVAATAVLLAQTLRELGVDRRQGLLIGLLYGLGTIATWYARTVMADPVIGLWLLLAARELLHNKPRAGIVGVWLMAAGFWKLSSIPLVVGLGLVAMAFLLPGRKFAKVLTIVAALWAPLAAAIGVYLLNDFVRTGGWLSAGYSSIFRERPAFPSRSIPGGLYEIVLGANGGLLPYTPMLFLLPFWIKRGWEERRRTFWVCIPPTVCAVVFFSRYFCYADSYSYGPRLLLPAVPLLLLFGGANGMLSSQRNVWERRTTTMLIACSLLLGLGCLLGGPSRLVTSYGSHEFKFQYTTFDIREAQIWKVWPGTAARWIQVFTRTELLHQAAATAADHTGSGLGEYIREETPDYWWLTAWLVGIPWYIAFFPPLLLSALIAFVSTRLRAILNSSLQASTSRTKEAPVP